jgi:hypothetical protein
VTIGNYFYLRFKLTCISLLQQIARDIDIYLNLFVLDTVKLERFGKLCMASRYPGGFKVSVLFIYRSVCAVTWVVSNGGVIWMWTTNQNVVAVSKTPSVFVIVLPVKSVLITVNACNNPMITAVAIQCRTSNVGPREEELRANRNVKFFYIILVFKFVLRPPR